MSSSDDDEDEDDASKRMNTSAITTSDGGNDKKKKEKDKEKKYQWPHGCEYRLFTCDYFMRDRIVVTPPLKNVRKRRFRKVARQKTQDHDEIEKEVRRLFR